MISKDASLLLQGAARRKEKRMQISPATSQKIKNMSLLCSFLVVAIHSGNLHYAPWSLGWIFTNTIKAGFADIAVPFFFIVSGFFLAQHFDEDGWWVRENKKRIRSLLIPFMVWSLVACFATIPLSIIADLVANRPFGTSVTITSWSNWPIILGLDFTRGPSMGQLWYVRCLLIYVLMGGAFKFCVSHLKYAWVAIAGVFYLGQRHIPCEILHDIITMGMMMGGVATGIFYLSIGIFIQRFKPHPTTAKRAIWCGIVGIALLLARLVIIDNGWLGQNCVHKFAVPFLIYATWHFMTAKPWPTWLTSCSFPIFLMHGVCISYFSVIAKRIPSPEGINVFGAFVCGVVGSIAITVLLRRYTPKLAGILFGGR